MSWSKTSQVKSEKNNAAMGMSISSIDNHRENGANLGIVLIYPINTHYILTQPMDPEKKSLNFFFPTKYVIPKSLKFSHWLSEYKVYMGLIIKGTIPTWRIIP